MMYLLRLYIKNSIYLGIKGHHYKIDGFLKMFRVGFKDQSVTLTLNLNFRSRPLIKRERDRDGIPERRSDQLDQLIKKKNSERQNANYQI